MTSSCHACGYDLSGIPATTRSCPECGVERSAWAARWPLRVADLGLTLCLWSWALAAIAWTINSVVAVWTSHQTAQNPGTVALAIPTLLFAAGLTCLAYSVVRSAAARWVSHAVCAVISIAALAAAIYYWWPWAGNGPLWLEGGNLAPRAKTVLQFAAPVAIGIWLARLSALSHMLGLDTIARRTRLAAWCVPVGAIVAFVAMVLWEQAFWQVAGQAPAPMSRGLAPGTLYRASFSTGYFLGWMVVGIGLALTVAATWITGLVVRVRLRDVLRTH